MEKSLKKGNRFSTLIRKTGVLWVMIVLYAVSVCVDPSPFLTGRNQINLLRNISLNGIIGLGMTFIILTGGIDLSVGSTVSVVAVSVAALLKNGVNPFLAVLAGILIGAAIGLINGLGVTKGKIPAFIMTLGTMTALEGVALIISAGKPVSWTESGIDFTWIGQKSLLGVPVVAFLFVILLLVCAFVLRYTPFGRGVYAIGDNKSAAKLCGINTFGVETLAYVIGGVLAAVTAIVYISRLNVGGPTVGNSMEMDAISITVIGGTSTSGGTGGVFGTLIGAGIIVIISNILNLLGVTAFVQQVVEGLIIILAVLLERLRDNRKS